MKTVLFTSWFRKVSVLGVMLIAATLTGCGGGGSSSSTTLNAGVGYFDNVSNTGGADVYSDSTNTTPLHIADLEGVLKGDQLMLVSVTENVAYFATLSSLSGTTYNADVRIYKDNVPYGTAKLTGTLTAGKSITGTLTGAGYGQGTFSLEISAENSQQADVTNIVRISPNFWHNIVTTSFTSFYLDSSGIITNNSGALTGNFIFCKITGSVTAIANSALYQFQITLSNCGSTVVAANGIYTGYVTTRSASSTNDTLVVMLENTTNGYAMYGEFQ